MLQINHDLPEKVIIFRDGVGDGQLNVVATYEQEQLSQCFAFFGETYTPQLAIVVVQKRINTRIFSASVSVIEMMMVVMVMMMMMKMVMMMLLSSLDLCAW